MRGLGAILLLSLLLTPAVSAQGTPEAAATAFGAAIKGADYAAAARIMHPSALRQLHQLFAPLVTAPKAGDMAKQLFGVESASAFASTPDTVLFARFLQTVMAQQAGVGEALRTAKIEALGHVAGSGDTALVVSRMTMTIQGITLSTFDVMPFTLYEGRYRGLLKADFTNMAAMLRSRLGQGS
jgi:hypothetical protein